MHSAGAPGALTPDTVDSWLSVIRPKPGELRFEEIGWRPSFFDAVAEAQARDRPILLWATDGHPVGAT
jgi:hypothetical protein